MGKTTAKKKKNNGTADPVTMSFWEHLDSLRTVIIKIIVVTVLFSIIVFCFKDSVFAVILAPDRPDFVTYGIMKSLAGIFSDSPAEFPDIMLINTSVAGQFMIHVRIALCVGVLCASPYILYQLFRFVSPALYVEEKSYALKITGWGYIMFIAGLLITYFIIFPFTFRFLGTYQVNSGITNMITLQSYISTLLTMSILIGLVFEMPVVLWLFAKLNIIDAPFLRKYRKHAVTIILIVAAIITPTSDIFTLLIVSLPIWLLYEISVISVARTAKKEREITLNQAEC